MVVRIETPEEFIGVLIVIAILAPIVYWLYGKAEK